MIDGGLVLIYNPQLNNLDNLLISSKIIKCSLILI